MQVLLIIALWLSSSVYPHKPIVHPDTKESQKILKQLEKKLKLSNDKALLERVQKISKPLIKIVNKQPLEALWGDKKLNPFEYHFKIIDEKEINAFSLPGGFIYVYKGLLDYVESDDELAGVIAHEICHIAFRHGYHMGQEQNKTMLIAIPAILLGAFFGGNSGFALGQASMLGSELVLNNWSQKAEWAADYGAIQLLIKSDYNPVGMLTFQERLSFNEQFKGKTDMGIYQTHPVSNERSAHTLSLLKKYKISIERSKVSKTMSTQVVTLENKNVDLQFLGCSIYQFMGPKALERATKAQRQINMLFDSGPNLFSVKIQKNTLQTLNGITLFQVSSSDIKDLSIDIETLTKNTLQRLKKAIYQLNTRLELNKL